MALPGEIEWNRELEMLYLTFHSLQRHPLPLTAKHTQQFLIFTVVTMARAANSYGIDRDRHKVEIQGYIIQLVLIVAVVAIQDLSIHPLTHPTVLPLLLLYPPHPPLPPHTYPPPHNHIPTLIIIIRQLVKSGPNIHQHLLKEQTQQLELSHPLLPIRDNPIKNWISLNLIPYTPSICLPQSGPAQY